MNSLFCNLNNIKEFDLSNLDTSQVTSMRCTFACSGYEPLDLTGFNTENVTAMTYMFGESQFRTINLGSFNTSRVTDMSGMFCYSQYLQTVYASDSFDVSHLAAGGGEDMFAFCSNLVGGDDTACDGSTHTDQEYARIDRAQHGGDPGYFTQAPSANGNLTSSNSNEANSGSQDQNDHSNSKDSSKNLKDIKLEKYDVTKEGNPYDGSDDEVTC